MTRSHRRFHRLFWLVATPLLVVFYFANQPDSETTTAALQQIPAGSSSAVFSVE